MKKHQLLIVLYVAVLQQLSATLSAQTADNEGPTMGWSSWNTYGLNIDETLIKKQANAMVSKGLKTAG